MAEVAEVAEVAGVAEVAEVAEVAGDPILLLAGPKWRPWNVSSWGPTKNNQSRGLGKKKKIVICVSYVFLLL